MVKPNDETKHSVEELGAKAKELHMDLVDWAETNAERTCVIAIIQQAEATFQSLLSLKQ